MSRRIFTEGKIVKGWQCYTLPSPKGWQIIRRHGAGAHYLHRNRRLQAILSPPEDGAFQDGRRWWHLSVSRTNGKTLSFEQMRDAKEEFLGDRYAVMVFPPEAHYVHQVGANPGVLHLWATDDDWPLPEFGSEGTL